MLMCFQHPTRNLHSITNWKWIKVTTMDIMGTMKQRTWEQLGGYIRKLASQRLASLVELVKFGWWNEGWESYNIHR